MSHSYINERDIAELMIRRVQMRLRTGQTVRIGQRLFRHYEKGAPIVNVLGEFAEAPATGVYASYHCLSQEVENAMPVHEEYSYYASLETFMAGVRQQYTAMQAPERSALIANIAEQNEPGVAA